MNKLDKFLVELAEVNQRRDRDKERYRANFLGDPPHFFWDLEFRLRHILVCVDYFCTEIIGFGMPGNWHELHEESVFHDLTGRGYKRRAAVDAVHPHVALGWYGTRNEYWLHLLCYDQTRGDRGMMHETDI